MKSFCSSFVLAIALCTVTLVHAHSFDADDPAEFFANTISHSSGPGSQYNEGEVLAAIRQFNGSQLTRSGMEDEDSLRPKGHHAASFLDAGSFFIVQFDITEEGHTAGVDVGENRVRSMVFEKKTLKKVNDFPGQLFGSHPRLRLTVPGRETCLGFQAEGPYSVYDLPSSNPLFSAALPKGTFWFEADNPAGGNSFLIKSVAQQLIPNAAKESTCELPYWARFTEATTVLKCDLQTRRCKRTGSVTKRYEQCADIGGCD